MTFDEEAVFRRSQKSHMDDDTEEHEAPISEDRDLDHQEIRLEPISEPEPPRDITRKRSEWFLDTLEDSEGHATP